MVIALESPSRYMKAKMTVLVLAALMAHPMVGG
jgi:hypothetical protein